MGEAVNVKQLEFEKQQQYQKDLAIKNMVDKKLEDKMNIHFKTDDIQEGMEVNGVNEF